MVGIGLFSSSSILANRDAVLEDLNSILIDANQYSKRPDLMGGGEGSFEGYVIPSYLASTDNGTYAFSVIGGKKKQKKGKLTLIGTSALGYGTVRMVIYDSLNISMKSMSFTGDFKQ